MLMALLGGGRFTYPYTSMSALEAIAAATCDPGSKSTDPILLHSILSEAAALGRPLFQLFSHPAGTLQDSIELNCAHCEHSGQKYVSPLHQELRRCPKNCAEHMEGETGAGVNPSNTRGVVNLNHSRSCTPNGGTCEIAKEEPKRWPGLTAGRVSDGAALIMRAIAESGAQAAAPMREVALSEGAVLHHLCVALSSRVSCLCNPRLGVW